MSSSLFQETGNGNHQNHEAYMGGGCLRGECEDYPFQELQHMDERTDEVVVAGEEESGGDGVIEMGKRYQTRDGRAVRVLCVDMKGGAAYPVVGLVCDSKTGNEFLQRWTVDGLSDLYTDKEPSNMGGLVPVPTKHEGWCVLHGLPYIFETREDAERQVRVENSQSKRIVAHLEWED